MIMLHGPPSITQEQQTIKSSQTLTKVSWKKGANIFSLSSFNEETLSTSDITNERSIYALQQPPSLISGSHFSHISR